MERIFVYETGFIKVSRVESVQYRVDAGSDHRVHVFLGHENLELTFDSQSKAEKFVKNLLNEVRNFHGVSLRDTGENIDISDMTAEEILAVVAVIRMNLYGRKGKAAESLGVDVRTLTKFYERGTRQVTGDVDEEN